MFFIKKHRFSCIVITVVLYILIGTMAPFVIYPEISEYTKATVSTEQFFENTASEERAMILETGQSAWEERIRLMDRAEYGGYIVGHPAQSRRRRFRKNTH